MVCNCQKLLFFNCTTSNVSEQTQRLFLDNLEKNWGDCRGEKCKNTDLFVGTYGKTSQIKLSTAHLLAAVVRQQIHDLSSYSI